MNSNDKLAEDQREISFNHLYEVIGIEVIAEHNGCGYARQVTGIGNLTVDRDERIIRQRCRRRAVPLLGDGMLAAAPAPAPAVGDVISFELVERICNTLSKLGVSVPESREEQAARVIGLIKSLCDEAIAPKQASAVGGEPTDDDWRLKGYAYASKQATNCAGCGKLKHTPLRIDAMGGYVCLTCIDQKLGSLLGEFGYPEQAPDVGDAVPTAWRLSNGSTSVLTSDRAYAELWASHGIQVTALFDHPQTEQSPAVGGDVPVMYANEDRTVAISALFLEGVRASNMGLCPAIVATYTVPMFERQQATQGDDSELDGTDAAHPAWWRGCDRGVDATCERIEDVLDGKDNGAGVLGGQRIEALRRRLLAAQAGGE